MPITIDEVTAEVAPPSADAGVPAARPPAAASPEQLARRQREQLEHLAERAARLRAD